ncbi:MAG: MerR family DNA-binding protein [Acidimicrobiales bacterium]
MRIGELAEHLGVTTKSIRFYESIGLMPEPARTASGYRDYAPADAERLTFIKTAQRLGLSLDEIREIIAFRDRGEPPCAYVAGVLRDQVADLDRRIREMRRLRDELEVLEAKAAAGAGGASAYCGVIEHVRLGRRPEPSALKPGSVGGRVVRAARRPQSSAGTRRRRS